jgi:hypothetical protein
MIGKTNAQTSAGGGIKGEKVNISLKTNQSSHEDLKGAIITVSYATVVEEYTWNGYTITVEIPPYVDYSVYTSGVEGYATPSSYSSTSVPENSKSVDLEYKTEVVSVTLSTDDGSSVKGASVTINGKSYTWNETAITQKIAFGTSYTISVGEVSGMSTPSSQSFTANQASRSVSFVYIASVLKLSILSNQSGDTIISSVKSTVTYGSTSVEVGNGETIGIPTDKEVTITFPSVEGYEKPSAITFTNSSGGVAEKSGTYYTEVLTVNVSADEGTISGYTVSVKDSSGNTLGSQTSDTKTYKIPSGTSYYVTASAISDYTTPSDSSTYTASRTSDASREVGMVYEIVKDETLTVNVSASDGSSVDGQVVTVKQQGIANGVYIEDINGKLWTEAEWNGSVTPNGVAVITDECQFVMALEDVDAQYWAPNYSGVPGAFLTNFLETAKTDYSGIVNTQKVVEKFSSDTGTAAYCCQNFIFPNGGKGYVGAVGEWQAVINNKDAIFSALSKCGAEEMVQTSSYWTSTMETAGRAWLGSLKNKTFTTDLVSKDYPVRAFTKLGSKPVSNGKATFTIPNGATYEVSVSEKDGYATPASQTFTAGDGTRTISMQYIPMKITTIRINQTITDPTSMITRIVDKGGIEAVRANSHRYTGTFANGVMTLKQLSDTDGTKYKDGSTATLNSAGVDVWMRLPQFYWKCTQYATDQWDFSVAYDTKPDNSYKEWDGNDLIGVYEGYAIMSQLLSRSGENVSYGSLSTFKDYARNRGEGYTLVKWKHHCMMAMLFYMQYGHTNAQNKIGPGNTTNKKTGGTDSLGMTDTVAGGNGSSGSINFWGLENWWGNYYEFIDNVIINERAWSITEDDGTVRAAGTGCSSNGWTTKMMFGDYMDLIPTIANASESTGFCDYYYQAASSNRVVARSWNSNSTNGGVAAVDCQYGTTSSKSSYGTRLAFRGEIKIVG